MAVKCPFLAENSAARGSRQGANSTHAEVGLVAETVDSTRRTLETALAIPVVKETPLLRENPVKFLLQAKRDFPDMFLVRRPGSEYCVLSEFEVDLFEEVVSNIDVFGDPVTPNMMVNHNVFQIPKEILDKYESKSTADLRRYLIARGKDISASIGEKMRAFLPQELGVGTGTVDLRDLANMVFWPMTSCLFGARCEKVRNPQLLQLFLDIDTRFGKALKGHVVQEVVDAVNKAGFVFHDIIQFDTMGPLCQFYLDIVKDPLMAAKFCTSAWWGGLGNTLPGTMWTIGHILNDPEVRRKAYDEVNRWDGTLDAATLPFISSCFSETLRIKTFSVSWRHVKKDRIMQGKSGKRYQFRTGMLVGVHWCLRHFDSDVYPDPFEFRPERFEATQHQDMGKQWSWAPFGRGLHKCSGYGLASYEIPLIVALFLQQYDLELIDPLPGLDWKAAFGVVGPDDAPARVNYRKR